MKNLLFVSIAFPPKSDAEGLQVAKYLKYLLRHGADSFAVDAVTSAIPTLNMPVDPSLEKMAHGVRQRIELPIYENRYSNFLLRKVLPWSTILPDPKFSFHLQSSKVIRQLRVKPDVIYSRSFPMSSAVMAYRLKCHFNVPWVMHLSDIWADCPEQNYRGMSREIQERFERMCFAAADVICVTSQSTLAFYQRKYRQQNYRMVYCPNVFDLEDGRGPLSADVLPAEVQNGKFRIVHTGSLVGSRSAAPLLAALSQLEKEIQDRLDVLLVGPIDTANTREIQRWNLPCVQCVGTVEYRESLRYQRTADLLILIDMPVANPALRVFFPSKLLDYMLAGLPILAIGEPGSETQHTLTEHDLGQYVERTDTDALVSCLRSAFQAGSGKTADRVRHPPDVFSAEYNALRLIDLLHEVTR